MPSNVPVFNGRGEVAFYISIPEGKCGLHYEQDPLRMKDRCGNHLLESAGSRRGLHGERINLYRVGGHGGDLVRLFELDPEDDVAWRQLFPIFGKRWWDIYESRFAADGTPLEVEAVA